MKATTRVTYDEPKDPREVEAEFQKETGAKATVTYVWADADLWQSVAHPVHGFTTRWDYQLEWEV